MRRKKRPRLLKLEGKDDAGIYEHKIEDEGIGKEERERERDDRSANKEKICGRRSRFRRSDQRKTKKKKEKSKSITA
jgi:hypothetical protein